MLSKKIYCNPNLLLYKFNNTLTDRKFDYINEKTDINAYKLVLFPKLDLIRVLPKVINIKDEFVN